MVLGPDQPYSIETLRYEGTIQYDSTLSMTLMGQAQQEPNSFDDSCHIQR